MRGALSYLQKGKILNHENIQKLISSNHLPTILSKFDTVDTLAAEDMPYQIMFDMLVKYDNKFLNDNDPTVYSLA